MSHVVAAKTTSNVFPSTSFNEFPDDFNERLLHDGRGMLSMANSGKNTNKSQFFFTLKPCPHLNRKHAVLGRVVGGHAVPDRLDKQESTWRKRLRSTERHVLIRSRSTVVREGPPKKRRRIFTTGSNPNKKITLFYIRNNP